MSDDLDTQNYYDDDDDEEETEEENEKRKKDLSFKIKLIVAVLAVIIGYVIYKKKFRKKEDVKFVDIN